MMMIMMIIRIIIIKVTFYCVLSIHFRLKLWNFLKLFFPEEVSVTVVTRSWFNLGAGYLMLRRL